jgi:uridine kinase
MVQPIAGGARAEDLLTLAKNPLLGKLPAHDLGVFLDLLDEVAFTHGTEILSEGEEGDYMYFVLEGEAEVRRGSLHIRSLGPGDHFGELALIGLRRRAATVVATTTMRLARFSRSRYLSLASRHPPIALHFLQALVTSLGDELIAMTDNVATLLGQRSTRLRMEARVTLGDGVRIVATGTPVEALLSTPDAVAALLDSRPVSLDTPIVSHATLAPITLESWEGRETFRRSASLLVLEAAYRVAPELPVRLRQSVSAGRIVELPSAADDELRSRVSHVLSKLVRENVPFREEVWSVDEAALQMKRQGWPEGAALLRSARTTTTTMVTCGSLYAFGTGPLLPAAEKLAGVRLLPHPSGMLIDFGPHLAAFLPGGVEAQQEALEREQKYPRFSSEMAREHEAWLRSMGVDSVGALNDMLVSGEVPRLVRVAEGFHEKRISRIADEIAARRGAVRVIGIAGPSSSGKTTFIKRLSVQLEVNGVHPKAISLDDYYVDRSKTPRDENGEWDFEALEALDLALLQDHLARIVRGEVVRTPRYDFKTGKSTPDGGPELGLGSNDVLLVEGIHGLNPALYGSAVSRDAMFWIFIHPQSLLPLDRLTTTSGADLRLLRRIVRDRHHRNYKAAENISRWPSVRRGEMKHIFPHYMKADVVFDSALVYELGVLKVYAERYLLEVGHDDPAYAMAYRLRRLVDAFVAIYPDQVPPTSIAREFIGGSGFEY